jgi:hypothetical protein
MRHLDRCPACRDALATARAALSTTQVDTPEPSPLFWDHFSARVRAAIEAEPRPPRSWWEAWRTSAVAFACTMMLAVGLLGLLREGIHQPRATSTATATLDTADPVDTANDDPALDFLADAASDVLPDAADVNAVDSGLDVRPQAIDHAMTSLSADERAELGRLLQDALKRVGE